MWREVGFPGKAGSDRVVRGKSRKVGMSDFSEENCRTLWREVGFPGKVGSHGVVRAKIRTIGRSDGQRKCRALFGEVGFPGKVGADILTFINFSQKHYNSRVDGAYTLFFEIYILECV